MEFMPVVVTTLGACVVAGVTTTLGLGWPCRSPCGGSGRSAVGKGAPKAYERVVTGLAHLKAYLDVKWDEELTDRKVSAEAEKELQRRASEARKEINLAVDLGGFLLSGEARERLRTFQKEDREASNERSWFEHLDSRLRRPPPAWTILQRLRRMTSNKPREGLGQHAFQFNDGEGSAFVCGEYLKAAQRWPRVCAMPESDLRRLAPRQVAVSRDGSGGADGGRAGVGGGRSDHVRRARNGKWRLRVDGPVAVLSLLSSPPGHLDEPVAVGRRAWFKATVGGEPAAAGAGDARESG